MAASSAAWGWLRIVSYFLLRKQYLSFPRRRESSFFALDPCFRRGDIVGFRFTQQLLAKQICEFLFYVGVFAQCLANQDRSYADGL